MQNKSLIISVISAGTLLLAQPASATIFFNDDFSTFTSGNLVGQPGYTQVGASATGPLQVAGGNVVVPGGQSVDNQDALRGAAVTLTDGTSLFMAASINISSAPSFTANSGNGSAYFLAIRSGGFDNGRIVAKTSSTDPSKYVLGVRATGQGANTFVFGTTELNFGQEYNVVEAVDLMAGATNDVFSLYVNPLSNRGASTVYASTVNAGTDPANPFNGVTISQFGNANVTTAGLSIGNLVLADDFGQAVNAVPEPATLAALSMGALALIRRRKQK